MKLRNYMRTWTWTWTYFNRRNFRERNFRDFANFCHFRESLSCEIAINLKFAKVYLAKFRKLIYSLKFDLNFVFFFTKTALFAATLRSLAKVYLAKFREILHSRKFISEISRFFFLAKVSLAKVSTIKVSFICQVCYKPATSFTQCELIL